MPETAGTLLALVGCPSCFAKLFRGNRFCAHCGAEAVREEAKPRPSAGFVKILSAVRGILDWLS